MLDIINSLFPIFVVILIGFTIKHYKLVDEGFWPGCEKLAYYLLLPVLLFFSIAKAEFDKIDIFLPIIIISTTVVIATTVFLLISKKILGISYQRFNPILQGSIYANVAYIGIPASYALFGEGGLLIYAVLAAFIVPVVNATVVIILTLTGQNTERRSILKKVIFHPIIFACIAGFAINRLGIKLPPPIFNSFSVLSDAAMPIGLIIVGGALNIKSFAGSKLVIFLTSSLKLLIIPTFVAFLCYAFKVDSLMAYTAILYGTLPCAAATYLIAKKMDGDAQLMASIIVSETILSAITIPTVIYFAKMIF